VINFYLKFKSILKEAGVFIDIDGVVLQGGVAYTWSEEAIRVFIFVVILDLII